jgi:hypothetical protein
VRDAIGEAYSYSGDYDAIGQLKGFAASRGICLLLVHHTRKQAADDAFDMISGTTGLLGCEDGALLLRKEKRTDLNATLDVVGRDQPDQRLHLTRDQDSLVWQLDHAERELWKAPPDPLLEKVAALVTPDAPEWSGSPSELVSVLDADMAANALTRYLNVNSARLRSDYNIEYGRKLRHEGRRIYLRLLSADDSAGCRVPFTKGSPAGESTAVDRGSAPPGVSGRRSGRHFRQPPRRAHDTLQPQG